MYSTRFSYSLSILFSLFFFFFSSYFISLNAQQVEPGSCIIEGGRTVPPNGFACVLDAFHSGVCDPNGSGQIINVQTCNDGCNASTGQCNSVPEADAPTLTPTPTATPTPDPDSAPEAAPIPVADGGQWTPQPGVNCGIPLQYGTNPDDPRHACCYPKLLSWVAVPTNIEPTPLDFVNSTLSKIGGFIGSVVDTLPFGIYGETPLPTIGKIRQALALTPPCTLGANPSTDDAKSSGCTCSFPAVGAGAEYNRFCNKIENEGERQKCSDCIGVDISVTGSIKYNFDGVWTGIGCIKLKDNAFIGSLMGWGIGISGGILFFGVIYAAWLYQTSKGNPEKLQKARELLISLFTGFVLIIFAVFILRVIGVGIFEFEGWG